MEQMELKFPATLGQQQLATIAAANIAGACYRLVTGAGNRDCSFVHDVELAVGEACINAVKYCTAVSPENVSVNVYFELNDKELIVIVKDKNEPFDFDKVPPPDFENVPEGGYGIFIMKEKMDEVHYERLNNTNIITMRKKIIVPEQTKNQHTCSRLV